MAGCWRALWFFVAFATTGCFAIPGNPNYQGPDPRPAALDQYYDAHVSYTGSYEKIIKLRKEYSHKELHVETAAGEIVVDYFQRPEKTKELVIIFPILGGKYMIEGYFARYFARHGYDTAIIHRDKDFKNPDQFDNLEEIFRKNIVRDRIALDFFERFYGKTKFGSFGISRGAINAAMTAGVDPRLKYNVLAMGGSHLLGIFKKTNVKGVEAYREKVQVAKGITKQQFFEYIEKTVKTDPKNLVRYLDANNTLLFLALFDKSVPFEYGMRMRREIGNPRTIFLTSGHVTSIVYTQFAHLLPPSEDFCLFPFDYIESESMSFYNNSFGRSAWSDLEMLPFKIVQLPVGIVSYIYWAVF